MRQGSLYIIRAHQMKNLQAVSNAATLAFDIQARPVIQKTWTHLYLSANGNKWHPNPLRAWLASLGIDNQRSYNKYIPDIVFRLPNEKIALFLRHLWATDGSIYLRKTTHGQTGTIYYSTSSERLAKQVQYLLSRLGIPARVAKVQKGTYRPNYHVSISGKENQMKYASQIGGFGERERSLAQLVSFYDSIQANPNLDTLPIEVWGLVKVRMQERNISQRQMVILRGTSYGGNAHFGFSPTREVLTTYAELLDDPKTTTCNRMRIFIGMKSRP